MVAAVTVLDAAATDTGAADMWVAADMQAERAAMPAGRADTLVVQLAVDLAVADMQVVDSQAAAMAAVADTGKS
jgi:hypothetical protein